ncbi:MAG TPA: lipoyl(octanoyl) transferase LipB [Candidatus Limnocylindrales bacterium]
MGLEVRWLGQLDYRAAWDLQHELVDARARAEIEDQLLLVEHPPVLTLGRQASEAHVLAGPQALAERGIELIRVERGGEVTYHGPGQLVAYPIVQLAQRGLLLRPFVRALEQAMIATAASFGVSAGRREGYPGCWVAPESERPRKLGALGLRVERGISYHGIALNVTTDVSAFGLIDPCGMPAVEVTTIAREAAWPAAESVPSTASVAAAAGHFADAFERLLERVPVAA